jgi:glycosyltransferase involved in cell wall biosynthesis
MKIAQIAPLYESVPPKYYGGTERVVSYLVEELVRQEHEVTLFASGDSQTSSVLVPICEQSLRLQRRALADPLAHHVRMLEVVFAQASEFDVLHFHLDYLHFPLVRRTKSPALTTLHGRLDIPDLHPLFAEFWEARLCSVSRSQQEHLTHANWLGSVHHGLPKELYQFHPEAEEYLVFLGRICPEKGVDRAIEIAIRVGMPLKIAAKVDAVDQAYFEQRIRRLLDHPLVDFIGEVGEQQKNDLLGKARALLFPIDWPEPFGLTMIEAMACGTPVVAYRHGSVPEIVETGENGFIVNSVEEAVIALRNIDSIQRGRCRQIFEQRFTSQQMASAYLSIYQKLAQEGTGERNAIFPQRAA